MAHLVLNPRTSFSKLKCLYKDYNDKKEKATDVFEKAEYEGFLNTIAEFCIMRGGYNYLRKIKS